MADVINKTMSRSDLFAEGAASIVDELDALIHRMYARGLFMTSWYGSLPGSGAEAGAKRSSGPRRLLDLVLGRSSRAVGVGIDNRGPDYEPLPGAADDARIPWYLYWEIAWVLTRGPELGSASRLLDAGGTSSLFTCYLASLGHEVHSIDLNEGLVSNGNAISQKMGWSMHSYTMNMERLSFDDAFFDHAFSICVFEHLDHEVKQAALCEIARVLKPGGMLSLTFDYRNPAPVLSGSGPDPSEANRLSSPEDLERCFLSTGLFELVGNESFHDNEESYLVHPGFADAPYTFGAMFLRKT
jgi:SAM-dependent methyltransferase